MNNGKIAYFLFLVGTSVVANVIASTETIVDTIIAIVSSASGTELITQSDLDRPTLFGQYRSVSDCEFEKAILLEAKKHKIDVDDAMVESYLESVQQAYHLTRKDIDQMFIDAGYTIAEGIEQLRTSQIVNIIVQREVYENISVSLQEVRAYCDAHPSYKQAEYVVERAIINQDEYKNQQAADEHYSFSPAITLQESEISSNHTFITKMRPGETHYASLNDGTVEVIRLTSMDAQRLLSVEERYNEIASMLQREKYERSFAQFKERMLNSVSIVHI